MKIPAPAFAEAASRRQAQGGGFREMKNMIIRSALTPLRESVTALPACLPQAGKAGHPADLPVNRLTH